VADPVPALLPATVAGSHSLPRWLAQARQARTSGALLRKTGGGNVTGRPGYNAARTICQDLGLPPWWTPPEPEAP
jgi:hypothetical protein